MVNIAPPVYKTLMSGIQPETSQVRLHPYNLSLIFWRPRKPRLSLGPEMILTFGLLPNPSPGHVGGQPEDGLPPLAVHAAAHVRARALYGGPAPLRLARRPQLVHAQAARVQVSVVLRTASY